MTVKRYDAKDINGGLCISEDASGRYVAYEDYAELHRQLTAYEATVTNLTAQVQGLAAEMEKYRNAHPQPFGREMMKALDEYEKHQDDVPETGMLNAFFILRDSIRVGTKATDTALEEIRNEARAEGVDPLVKVLTVIANSEEIDGDTVVCDFSTLVSVAAGALRDHYAQELRKEQRK